MDLFDITIFAWIILSLIIKADQSILLRDFAVNIVFPIFILGVVFERYGQKTSFANFIFYPFLKFLYEKKHYTPLEAYSYFRDHLIAFVPIFFYAVIQTLRHKKAVSGEKQGLLGRVGLKNLDTKQGHIGFLSLGVKLIGQLIVAFSRYIAIIVGIVASLISISLPNTFMLVFSLFLLVMKKYDDRLWNYYMYYSIGMITVMFVHHKIPVNIESFNIEVLAILGLIKERKICKIYSLRYCSIQSVLFLRLFWIYLPSVPERRFSQQYRRGQGAVSSPKVLQVKNIHHLLEHETKFEDFLCPLHGLDFSHFSSL